MEMIEDLASGETAQATPQQVAGFGPDRAARDRFGRFRPARLDPADRTTVQVLDADGVFAEAAFYEPAVITRIERLEAPEVTADGMTLPFKVTVSSVTGRGSCLPQHVIRTSDVTAYASLSRLPQEGHGGAVYDLTAFIEEQHLEEGHPDPYEELQQTLAHVFERTGLRAESAHSAPGYLWRCHARRYTLAQLGDFLALKDFPELDDAIMVPHVLRSDRSLVAVPLRRTASGLLFCAVGPRPGDAGETPFRVDSYAELSLEREDVPPSDASYVLSHGIDVVNERVTAAGSARAEAAEEANRCRAAHEQDMETLSDYLIGEAESRNWCSDYDDFVDRVNDSLSVPLRPRTRDYDVEVTATFEVTVRVNAANEGEARRLVDTGAVMTEVRDKTYSVGAGDWTISDVCESD